MVLPYSTGASEPYSKVEYGVLMVLEPPVPNLSATTYAVLGLLCVSEWSAYDLVRQMERGWADTWPRAVSGIYREPKKLVEHGYATERSDPSHGRPRTLYSATPAGRTALRDWLATGCVDPKLEVEALLRVLFAEHGTKEQLLAAIDSVGAYGRHRSEALLRQGDDYLNGEPPFPDRLHVVQLVGGFHAFYLRALIDWSNWARTEVTRWHGTSADDVPNSDDLTRDVAERFRKNLLRTRSPASPPAEPRSEDEGRERRR